MRLAHLIATALTPRQRVLIEAHYFEALSQGEIARRLGVSQQVVQRQLHGVIRRGKRIGGAIPRLRAALTRLGVDGHDDASLRGHEDGDEDDERNGAKRAEVNDHG